MGMTDSDLIAACHKAGFSERQWSAMTTESGPYDITVSTNALRRFAEVVVESQAAEIERLNADRQLQAKLLLAAHKMLMAADLGPSSKDYLDQWAFIRDAEIERLRADADYLKKEAIEVLNGAAQLMDSWRFDESWSAYDTNLRERVSALLSKLYSDEG